MRLLLLFLIFLISAPSAPSASAADVLVFAAASTTEVMHELAREHEQETGVKIVVSVAGSGTLARQIEHGAPAAVVVLADNTWMDYLAQRELIYKDSRKEVASNRLVLVTGKKKDFILATDSTVPLAAQFTGRLALPDPASVPAGAYAKQALQHAGWWDGVVERLAPTADVRAALRLVERGACDVGIVYASDVQASATVRVVLTLPETAHAPILYPAALTTNVASNPHAAAFLKRLTSPAAAACWQRHGFSAGFSPIKTP